MASLVACAREGLVRVEVTAGDGTKVKANASMAANATAEQLGLKVAELEKIHLWAAVHNMLKAIRARTRRERQATALIPAWQLHNRLPGGAGTRRNPRPATGTPKASADHRPAEPGYPARDKKFLRQASFRARGSWNAQPTCPDGDRRLIGSGDWPCSGCPFPPRHYQG